jgi:hypothetical protein
VVVLGEDGGKVAVESALPLSPALRAAIAAVAVSQASTGAVRDGDSPDAEESGEVLLAPVTPAGTEEDAPAGLESSSKGSSERETTELAGANESVVVGASSRSEDAPTSAASEPYTCFVADASAVAHCCDFHVWVDTGEVAAAGGFATFGVVVIGAGGSKLVTRRRFSEFVTLRNSAHAILPGSALPPLPPKTCGRTLHAEFLERRGKALSKFLSALFSAGGGALARSPTVRAFIGLHDGSAGEINSPELPA